MRDTKDTTIVVGIVFTLKIPIIRNEEGYLELGRRYCDSG